MWVRDWDCASASAVSQSGNADPSLDRKFLPTLYFLNVQRPFFKECLMSGLFLNFGLWPGPLNQWNQSKTQKISIYFDKVQGWIQFKSLSMQVYWVQCLQKSGFLRKYSNTWYLQIYPRVLHFYYDDVKNLKYLYKK